MARLYQLPAMWDAVQRLIDEAEGEIAPDVEKELDWITGELSSKVDPICSIIAQQNAAVEMMKKEIDRMRLRMAAAQRNADSLKKYLKDNLEKMGLNCAAGDRFKVTICSNAVASVEYTGEIVDLPVEYVRITTDINKQAILDALSHGEELPKGVTVTKGRHLRIR